MSGKIVAVRYKQDAPGRTAPYPKSPYLPFSRFCTSARVQGLALKVAGDIAVFAKAISPESETEVEEGERYKDKFITKPGKHMKIDGLNRATALVGNTAAHAAAVEFGSGEPSVGDTSGETRPQGGYNYAYRVLGRAGRAFGDWRD